MKLSLFLGASLLAVCAATSVANAGPVDFAYTGGFQTFTVASSGLYEGLSRVWGLGRHRHFWGDPAGSNRWQKLEPSVPL
jgi:hypothetical protein